MSKFSKNSSTSWGIFWLVWTLATTLFVFEYASFKYGYPVWSATAGQFRPFVLLTMAHLAIGAIITIQAFLGKQPKVLTVLLLSLSIFGIATIALFVTQSSLSRILLPATIAVSLGGNLTGVLVHILGKQTLRTAALGLSIAVSLVTLGLIQFNPGNIVQSFSQNLSSSITSVQAVVDNDSLNSFNKRTIPSGLYNIEVTSIDNFIPMPVTRGGGITKFKDKLVLVTGDGVLYLLDIDSKEKPFQELAVRVPFNFNEFGDDYNWQPDYIYFRVTDVLIKDLGDGKFKFFLPHHSWNREKQCYTIQLSTFETTEEALLNGEEPNWEVLYETSPCESLIVNEAYPEGKFVGMLGGGRLIQYYEDHVVLSLGDHGGNGTFHKHIIAQDPETPLGKTIKINIHTGENSYFTIGHRNPQGLFIDEDGLVWETEHGPQGGDEVNLLVEGNNYGWPLVTYGKSYGGDNWPLATFQGRHDGYTQPLYSFVPSIGISNLLKVQKDLFPYWKGDLLVSSMQSNLLNRIRVEDGRVILVEPINLGHRLRDIIEMEDGRIVFWTDEASILVLSPSTKSNALPSSMIICATCHTMNQGGPARIGPNLWEIMDKPIASDPTFKYSNAFRNKSGNWNDETLHELLKDPAAFAPGNLMVMPGMTSEETRNEVVDYLKSLQ